MEDKINSGEGENPQNEVNRVEMRLPEEFVRFSPLQRVEHLLVMIFFIVLVITGLPQGFFETSWAVWIIMSLGGIDMTRFIHRLFGILFAALAIWHLGRVTLLVLLRNERPSMVPTFKDFSDGTGTLKYSLGPAAQNPKFHGYDYRQKFEYW